MISSIDTHILVVPRETVRYLGDNDSMTLQARSAKDHLGRSIIRGNLTTAEGEAHLQELVSDVSLDVWLNRYAGPAGEQEGLRLYLHDGHIINYDRQGADDAPELIDGDVMQRWCLSGMICTRRLMERIPGTQSLFRRSPQKASRTTRCRLEGTERLLILQQQLCDSH